jgi:hypothetical protein
MASRFNLGGVSVRIFFALIAAALVTCSILRGPLSWDGAFCLFEVLDRRFWFVQDYRFIDVPLEFPVLFASHFTSNLNILAMLYSLSCAAVPMLGLAASYLICRKRPELFIWPALGISVATLPGIFCFNSEAIMAASLFWPVLLATLIGVDVGELALVASLAMTVLVSHPSALAFFVLGTMTAFVSAKMSPAAKHLRYAGAFGLGLLGLVRLLSPITDYERRQLGFATLRSSFNVALKGWPLAFLALTLVVVILCLIQRPNRSPKSFTSDFALPGILIAAGLMLVPWAINPHSWWKSLDYRNWVIPISGVVMGACALDAWRNTEQGHLWRGRQPALIAIGAVFFVVLSLQSLSWNQLTNRLLDAMRAGGCVPRRSLTWIDRTPLDHWATGAYAIVLQERTAHSLVLDGDRCGDYAANGTVNILWLARKKGDGWFDLDHVRTDASPSRLIK